jgi:hypothetical protein
MTALRPNLPLRAVDANGLNVQVSGRRPEIQVEWPLLHFRLRLFPTEAV